MKHYRFRFACLGVLSLITLVAIGGCRQEETPSRDFLSSELLVQLDDLPAHWQSLGPPERLDITLGRGDEDDSIVGFSIDGMHTTALHYIYQERSQQAAVQLFENEVVAQFQDESIARDVPWELPSELDFTSPYTERLRMGCTIIAGSQVCRVMAQYEEYVTVFRSTISQNTITLSQFNDLVQTIDERFARLLALQPVDSGKTN